MLVNTLSRDNKRRRSECVGVRLGMKRMLLFDHIWYYHSHREVGSQQYNVQHLLRRQTIQTRDNKQEEGWDWQWLSCDHDLLCSGHCWQCLDTGTTETQVEWVTRVVVTVVVTENSLTVSVAQTQEVIVSVAPADDHIGPPTWTHPRRVATILSLGHILRSWALVLQGHGAGAAARGQWYVSWRMRTVDPGNGGLRLGWDGVATWQRTRRLRGRGRLGGDEEHGLDDVRWEVEITAGLAWYPGLVSKLNLDHVVSLGHEDRAHVSTVTPTLHVHHQLHHVSAPLHHVMAGDVTLLGVQHVLGVPQLEALLSTVDVELHTGVQRGPGVVLRHPGGQITPSVWTINWNRERY